MTIRDNGKVIANTFVGALYGNASTATKLTSSAGNAALPIYFSDGKPVACTASSIFSNLSNSGNNISVTVAGQNRTLTVGYATSAGYANGIANKGLLDSQEKIDNFITANRFEYATFKTTESNNLGFASNDGMILSIPWISTTYGAQMAFDDVHAATVKVRCKSTSWGNWHTLLHSGNYNNYAPSKTGIGASGTWGINISGNAATATSAGNADTLDGNHASAFATAGHNHNDLYVSSLTTNGNYLRWVKNGNNNDITIPYATSSSKLMYHSLIGYRTDFDNFTGENAIKVALFQNKGTDDEKLVPPFYDGSLISFPWNNANNYGAQLVVEDGGQTNHLAIRNRSGSNTWGAWAMILTSANYNLYGPKLDGTGASGTWDINITGNADTVDGYHATSGNNKPWGTIPVITTGGYMDIGKHLEFHHDNTTGSDYSTVLMCTGNHGNIVNLPSKSGILALTTDIPLSLKNPHALTISLNGTSQGPYDGSAAKNINITPSSIGAATSEHNHTYIVATDKRDSFHGQILSGSGLTLSLMNGTRVGINSDYCDAIIFDSWIGPTAGESNALMFAKDNTNVYHTQVPYKSTTSWGTPIKFWDSNNLKNVSQLTNDSGYITSSGSCAYATSAGNADTLDGLDSTKFLRQVVVPNNTENDFNTFSNMTLTGRVDPTTGASLKNAPWSGSGPAGGYGVLTYLFSGYDYGTQMAWGYGNNRIYIRNKYYSGHSEVGAVWRTSWDTLALTSDIPTSLKNPNSLILKANGTTLAIYDGSSAKEANFTYANVGAASASHTHSSITIPVCSSLDENSDVFRIEYAVGSNSVTTKPSGVDAFGVIQLRTA